jgi:hypothetical protein
MCAYTYWPSVASVRNMIERVNPKYAQPLLGCVHDQREPCVEQRNIGHKRIAADPLSLARNPAQCPPGEGIAHGMGG